MFTRNHASRRNAVGLTRQKDSLHQKKVSPETLTEHADAVEHAECQAIGDRGFVDEMLSQIKPHMVCGAMSSESPCRAYRSSTGKCVCELLTYLEPRTAQIVAVIQRTKK